MSNKSGFYNNFVVDLVSGFCGGILNCITGHPLDTIKTRMQIYHGKSMMVVLVNTFKYEGIRGFYNGMSFPLYSIPILNSVIFLTNELAKKIFPNEDNTENFFFNSFLSGAIAGMFGCLIASPVELVKCRMQIQEKNVSSSVKFKSSIECFKYLLLKDKLYRGLFATILRDVVGYSFQFSGYINLNLYLNAYEENDEKHFFKIYICGAFAGLCCWQFSYPQDVIKTIIQTDYENKFKGNIIKATKYLYQIGGYKIFWIGYVPCMMRAIYANGFLYVGYEYTKSIMI